MHLLIAGMLLPIAVYITFLIFAHWRLSMRAEPMLTELSDGNPLVPDEIMDDLRSLGEALPNFVSLGLYVADISSGVKQYLHVLDDPATGDCGSICVTRADAASHFRDASFLALMTGFADGSALLTTNAHVLDLCPAPNVRRTVIPAMADAQALLDVHRAMVADTRQTNHRATPWRQGCLAWVRGELKGYRDRCLQLGYYRLDRRTADLRLTWKAIVLRTALTVWPVGQLRLRYVQWKANRLLSRIGLPIDYARQKPVKILLKHSAAEELPPQRSAAERLPLPEGLFCPKCDYNLTGVSANRCPECGEPFDPVELGQSVPMQLPPIALSEAIGQICAPLFILAPLVALGVGLAYVTSRISEIQEFSGGVGLLGIVFVAGSMIMGSYASSFQLARRLAVTRAQARGSEGSGLHDRTYIRLLWASIFVLQCLMILSAAGVVLFLLIRALRQ